MKDKKEDKEVLKSTGRPIIKNKDGSIYTELSITVNDQELNGGKYTNIPSIVNGKRVSTDEAVRHAIKNQAKDKYPSFNSLGEAVKAAKARSKQLGKDWDKQRQEKKDK